MKKKSMSLGSTLTRTEVKLVKGGKIKSGKVKGGSEWCCSTSSCGTMGLLACCCGDDDCAGDDTVCCTAESGVQKGQCRSSSDCATCKAQDYFDTNDCGANQCPS
ncbi:MAG: hypothetical protein QM528_06875 [Phycisphaerales bacterium]|nr:hypothetical protein [Phycisphaerales bacterium]